MILTARVAVVVIMHQMRVNIADLWLPAAIVRPGERSAPPSITRAFHSITPALHEEAEVQLNVSAPSGPRHIRDYARSTASGVNVVAGLHVSGAGLYTLFGRSPVCHRLLPRRNILLWRSTSRAREMAIPRRPRSRPRRIVRNSVEAAAAGGGLVRER